jgi:hypothetical protein
MKPPKENRRKVGQQERTHREGHEGWAGHVKTFRAPAMLKTTPLDFETKSNLRVERRDPWRWQTRCQKQRQTSVKAVKTWK